MSYCYIILDLPRVAFVVLPISFFQKHVLSADHQMPITRDYWKMIVEEELFLMMLWAWLLENKHKKM